MNASIDKIRMISVPYDSGQHGQRMGYGPIWLLEKGLEEKFSGKGCIVGLSTIRTDAVFPLEVGTTFELLNKLKSEVLKAFQAREFPLVLSGNCSSSAGVMGAYDDPSVGVIWFDAHGDCETPDTTSSGFLDGMALSMLLNKSWKTKMGKVKSTSTKGEQIVLVGARDMSTFEEKFMIENRIQRLDVSDLRSDGTKIISVRQQLIENGIKSLHLHVDVDVLDPRVGITNAYSVDQGLLTKEVIQVIQSFKEDIPISSAVISAYDPTFDDKGQVHDAIEEIINAIVFDERNNRH